MTGHDRMTEVSDKQIEGFVPERSLVSARR